MECSVKASLANGSVTIEMSDPKGMLCLFVLATFLTESFAEPRGEL
jgi:hypothetical protein